LSLSEMGRWAGGRWMSAGTLCGLLISKRVERKPAVCPACPSVCVMSCALDVLSTKVFSTEIPHWA